MRKPYVYVASSWRNQPYEQALADIRACGLDCYDFRNPPGMSGFAWAGIAEDLAGMGLPTDFRSWTAEEARTACSHPRSRAAFQSDRRNLVAADATILVLPCGRSAHLELGVAVGLGQATAVYHPDGIERQEPELMHGFCDVILGKTELVSWCADLAHSVQALRRP